MGEQSRSLKKTLSPRQPIFQQKPFKGSSGPHTVFRGEDTDAALEVLFLLNQAGKQKEMC